MRLLIAFATGLLLAASLAAQPRFGAKTSSTQQANLQKLQNDLAAIQAKSQVAPQMIQELAASLMAMVDGAVKPSQTSIDKLASDLSAALADKHLSTKELAQLTSDLNKVLDSANISTAEFNAVVEDAKAILTASGVTRSDVQLIVADLQAIGAELKKNIPSSSTKSTTAPSSRRSFGGRRP